MTQKFAVIKHKTQLIVLDDDILFSDNFPNVIISPSNELKSGEYSILDCGLDFTQAMRYINTAKAYLP